MDLSTLVSVPGSRSKPKRVGRGKGSGLGQTSGKGHKGQLARTGGKVRRGFEGGQSPLSRRLPKRGFSNVEFANEFTAIAIDVAVNAIKSGDISEDALKALGLAKTAAKIKLIGGKLPIDTSLLKRSFKVSKITGNLLSQINQAGGTAE